MNGKHVCLSLENIYRLSWSKLLKCIFKKTWSPPATEKMQMKQFIHSPLAVGWLVCMVIGKQTLNLLGMIICLIPTYLGLCLPWKTLGEASHPPTSQKECLRIEIHPKGTVYNWNNREMDNKKQNTTLLQHNKYYQTWLLWDHYTSHDEQIYFCCSVHKFMLWQAKFSAFLLPIYM